MKNDGIINYNIRLIAFVDLLGFKNYVDKSADGTREGYQLKNNIDKIMNLIDGIKIANDFNLTDRQKVELDNMFYKATHNFLPKIQLTFFSDCIVISTPIELNDKCEINYVKFLDRIIQIALQCTTYGFLLRGSITCGKLTHEEAIHNICYGPAMNRAYLIENKKAVYPRILIDAFAIKELLRDKNHADIIRKYLKADTIDGEMFLDYLGCEVNYKNDKYLEKQVEDYKSFLMNVKNLIVKNIEIFKNNDNIYSKYLWYKNYYNDTIKKVLCQEQQDEFLIK